MPSIFKLCFAFIIKKILSNQTCYYKDKIIVCKIIYSSFIKNSGRLLTFSAWFYYLVRYLYNSIFFIITHEIELYVLQHWPYVKPNSSIVSQTHCTWNSEYLNNTRLYIHYNIQLPAGITISGRVRWRSVNYLICNEVGMI